MNHHEVVSGARWFAGKDRTVDSVTMADRIEPEGAAGAAVHLVEVVYADGGRERYALALRDGVEATGDDPLWAALARSAGVDTGGGSRFLADDLSNTVVALGEAHVVKLYRRPEPGIHPEVELLDALERSPHAPSLEGSLVVEGTTLASVQAYVPGQAVGWESLIGALVAGDTPAGLPTELAHVTVSLHRMLAERLGTTAKGLQRIHGDLHVGQFLRAEGTLVVVDWEGRPDLSLAERREPRPALLDLASLRLSLAHAARAAHRRSPRLDWREWASAARDEALAAYGDVDREMLQAFELEKELAELAYAKRWLPEWLYVPTDVLPFVREGG